MKEDKQKMKTLEDFAEDIELRCGQLQLNGQQMVEAFVRGLRPNIRAAVIKDQPANLTAAINSARVAQSLSASEHVGVADTVKSAIEEQLKLVKEEIAALTVNVTSAIPSDVTKQQPWQTTATTTATVAHKTRPQLAAATASTPVMATITMATTTTVASSATTLATADTTMATTEATAVIL